MIFDAVVRTKLAYGLATAALTQAQVRRWVAFQMPGIQQIMGVRHPYVDRRNTNQVVLKAANEEKGVKHGETLRTFSKDYATQRCTQVTRLGRSRYSKAPAHRSSPRRIEWGAHGCIGRLNAIPRFNTISCKGQSLIGWVRPQWRMRRWKRPPIGFSSVFRRC